MTRRVLINLAVLVFIASVHGQSATPPGPAASRRIGDVIYAPKPVYLRGWSRAGLTGKGIVLATVDKPTGTVIGVRMLKSTGSKLLDGSALEAFSQWRFKPGTVSQVKIPIEFTNRLRR